MDWKKYMARIMKFHYGSGIVYMLNGAMICTLSPFILLIFERSWDPWSPFNNNDDEKENNNNNNNNNLIT